MCCGRALGGGSDGGGGGVRLRADCCDLGTIIQLVLSLISIILFHFPWKCRPLTAGQRTASFNGRD